MTAEPGYPDSSSTRVGRFTLRQLSVVQWIGVVVAPLAWTGQHVVGYGVGQARCEAGANWGIAYNTWQLAILAAAVLLVLVSEAAAVTVFLATRETNYGDGPPGDGRWGGAVPYSRLHFFATAAMVANVLFLVIILLDSLGAVANSLCVQS
jgi:heme/copper-type cytochrome/quinol oxidase subunit 2